MAFEIGTASDYRDFWRKLVNFQLNNSDVLLENAERTLMRGYFNPDIDYLTSAMFEENGILQWDIATCMGWDNTYQLYTDGNERKVGWLARIIDQPNYLGFSSITPITPTYYTISPRYWLGEADQSAKCPKDWIIEWSDDNTIWNLSDTVSNETAWLYNDMRTFPITGGTHKYWRINITANNGDATYVEIGRLRFYDALDAWISRGYTTEYLFRAPGWMGTDNVYYGMRLQIDPNQFYNVEWMGAIGFDDFYGWESQPSQSNKGFSALWEFDTPYWFFMNGARLITVANVGERWIASYNGKFFPFGTPAQYAYPMIISGSRNAAHSYTSTVSVGHIQALLTGTLAAGNVFRPNTGWSNLSGQDPYGNINGATTCIAPSVSGGRTAGKRQLLDSAYVLAPYIVEIDNSAYGYLDGIRWITGDNQIPGNIVLDETGQEWLVVCNHHYIGIDNFCVMELK